MTAFLTLASIFGNFGITEAIIIFAVLLLFFGARKLPDLARSLGKSVNEFKKGINEGAKSKETEENDSEKTPQKPT